MLLYDKHIPALASWKIWWLVLVGGVLYFATLTDKSMLAKG